MDEFMKTKCVCPITKKIFYEPMLAKDGHIYEEQAILEWLGKSRASPVTNNRMKEKLKPMIFIKDIINEYIKLNPSLKEHQYVPIKSHSYNKRILESYFRDESKYEKLLEYNEFNMELFFSYDYQTSFIKNAPVNVVKYFIDNCIDIETQAHNGNRFLHYVCELAVAEIIIYILSKNIDLKSTGNNNKNILHCICINPNVSIALLKEVIGKIGVQHVPDKKNATPYDYLCIHNTDKYQLIKFYIDNIIDVKKDVPVAV